MTHRKNGTQKDVAQNRRISETPFGLVGGNEDRLQVKPLTGALTIEVNRPSRKPDAEQRRGDTNKKEYGGS